MLGPPCRGIGPPDFVVLKNARVEGTRFEKFTESLRELENLVK
jgi:hypothetical protein